MKYQSVAVSFLYLNPQLSRNLTSQSLAAESSSPVSTLSLVNIPLESTEFPIEVPPMGREAGTRDQ